MKASDIKVGMMVKLVSTEYDNGLMCDEQRKGLEGKILWTVS